MTMDLKYLKLLAGQYPTEGKALAEMIRLQGVQRLPKGTELFLSDLHGEDEAFTHILNNASGVIYEKIATALPDLPEEDRRALASLIYYPHEQLARVGEEGPPGGWGRTLRRLLQVARVTAAKYSGRYVRAAMPEDLGYLLEELLSDHDRENRAQYVSGILSAAQEAGSAADLARALCALIKRLAVARLHIVGDVYDRGPHADVIMDSLMQYHSVDMEWGNHDILWMGAAAGSAACVACAVRNCLQYDNMDMLENSYGVNLLPLAMFANRTYTDDAQVFAPRSMPGELYLPQDPVLFARMHKAISVIQYKLEGQLVRRRPEYGMADRDVLSRVDWHTFEMEVDGKRYPLRDRDFPTIDPRNPLELTDAEYILIGQLVDAFRRSEKLQQHVRFLYRVGNDHAVLIAHPSIAGLAHLEGFNDTAKETHGDLEGNSTAGLPIIAHDTLCQHNRGFIAHHRNNNIANRIVNIIGYYIPVIGALRNIDIGSRRRSGSAVGPDKENGIHPCRDLFGHIVDEEDIYRFGIPSNNMPLYR